MTKGELIANIIYYSDNMFTEKDLMGLGKKALKNILKSQQDNFKSKGEECYIKSVSGIYLNVENHDRLVIAGDKEDARPVSKVLAQKYIDADSNLEMEDYDG